MNFDFTAHWFIFFLTIFLSLIAFEIGFLIGKKVLKQHQEKKQVPLDPMVSAMLGLLAFMLAFTFGFAGARFEEKRNGIVEEANAIETTYLRAGYLEEPYKTGIRTLLRNYVGLRLDVVKTRKYQEFIDQTEDVQQKLWEQGILVIEKGRDTQSTSLFLSSLNDVIDWHLKRMVYAFEMKIPTIIWLVLFFLMILSMGSLGYLSGLKGLRNFVFHFILVLAFSSVIYVIADLDHTQEGFLRVSQKPLSDLLSKMNKKIVAENEQDSIKILNRQLNTTDAWRP